MTKKNQVLGRYLYLYDNYKSKDMRKRTLKKEVLELWKKLNFPSVSDTRLSTLLTNLIGQYESYRKNGAKFKYSFNTLIDITKVDGRWLYSEDKRLYSIQIESKIGYTTAKIAQKNSVHPSKRDRRISPTWLKQEKM